MGAFNTLANAAIHRPVADVTSKLQLREALAQVDAKFQAPIATGRSVTRRTCRTSSHESEQRNRPRRNVAFS
jgi:hypothetical protein